MQSILSQIEFGGCNVEEFREGLKDAGECVLKCIRTFFGGEAVGAAFSRSAPRFAREAAKGLSKISTGVGAAQLLICAQECEDDGCK